MSELEIPFGERLVRWLDVLGMRQSTLARGLGVSAPTVHGWLSGRESPRIDRLHQIAVVLGISLTDFFGPLPEVSPLARSPQAAPTPDDEELPPHPGTGDITREIDIRAMERQRASCACPSCGRACTCARAGEAA